MVAGCPLVIAWRLVYLPITWAWRGILVAGAYHVDSAGNYGRWQVISETKFYTYRQPQG